MQPERQPERQMLGSRSPRVEKRNPRANGNRKGAVILLLFCRLNKGLVKFEKLCQTWYNVNVSLNTLARQNGRKGKNGKSKLSRASSFSDAETPFMVDQPENQPGYEKQSGRCILLEY
ncbi:MAG: hypothetical protein IKE01_02945 [Clostridia bacterium]|nr:hypothetical protein [Clostridia bacterium]